jgi:hypothetical protein
MEWVPAPSRCEGGCACGARTGFIPLPGSPGCAAADMPESAGHEGPELSAGHVPRLGRAASQTHTFFKENSIGKTLRCASAGVERRGGGLCVPPPGRNSAGALLITSLGKGSHPT